MGWPALRHSRAFVPGHMRCLHLAWGVFAAAWRCCTGVAGCLSYRHGCLSFGPGWMFFFGSKHPMLSDSFGHCNTIPWALKALFSYTCFG